MFPFLFLATATQEIARTNQNPKNDWRIFAPPIIFWVLYQFPKWQRHFGNWYKGLCLEEGIVIVLANSKNLKQI